MCFQREKGEAASLEGRKAMQVFKRPRGARQKQRIRLHLPPTVGRWLMQCHVLLWSYAKHRP